MPNGKEDALERKRSVVALYLMGNVPEKISEKLALPAKNVRKDLRSMGIAALEENLKSEAQVVREVRQEAELMKQELWNMYVNSKNNEEKLKILSEIRQTLGIKSETAGQIVKPAPVVRPQVSEKSLWKDIKENFFENGSNGKPKEMEKKEAEKPQEIVEIIEVPKECPPPRVCAAPAKQETAAPEGKAVKAEETPSKAYIPGEEWDKPCEGKEESIEIVELKDTENSKEKKE
ncbi:MAG: hypothetical protein JW727_02260 [Candidatus Aenigmarchaeota archaeon]|nr:hypothetical protein [Candidatus Aenigmarchaeota archaeon]